MAASKKTKIPIGIILFTILFLALQTPEDTWRVSNTIQAFCISIFNPGAGARWAADGHWFRTLLHAPLYFLLGLAVAYSFRYFWRSVGICCFAAVMDETLKIFLPTREFDAVDLIFDAIGFLIGIGIVMLLYNKILSGKVKGKPFQDMEDRDVQDYDCGG